MQRYFLHIRLSVNNVAPPGWQYIQSAQLSLYGAERTYLAARHAWRLLADETGTACLA